MLRHTAHTRRARDLSARARRRPMALSSPDVTAAVEQALAFFERPRALAQARGGRPRRRPGGLLPEELQALARFVAPEHEYSAVARALVDPVLEELTG
jgi:hypothetical protein